MDFKENRSYLSGGTNTKEELTSRRLEITFEHCGTYEPTSEISDCATNTEFKTFFEKAKFTVYISDNYVDFQEKETDKAVKTKIAKAGVIKPIHI